MNKFNPEKLSVQYRNGVTSLQPVIPRRCTLSHSDDTGDLFLTIGSEYAWDKVNPQMRDEVLAEWCMYGSHLYFYVYLYIDQGEYDQKSSAKRAETFRRELPLALSAIRYGDQLLINQYPYLDHAMIIIHFISVYPQCTRQENWGTFNSLVCLCFKSVNSLT